MEHLFLTNKNMDVILGKTIKWTSAGYTGNGGGYKGISKILEIDSTKKNPFKTETISGENFDYAFVENFENKLIKEKDICFSDGDRFVVVLEISESSLLEKIDEQIINALS